MKKRERLNFTSVRPPRLPSIMHWKPTTQRANESLDASEPEATSRPPLELVTDEPADKATIEAADEATIEATEEGTNDNLRRLLSWPIVTPRADPPGHTIGLREV